MQTKAGDTLAAESVIELMRKDSIVLPEEAISKILSVYSDSGNIPAADQLIKCFLAGLILYFSKVFSCSLLPQAVPLRRNDIFM